MVENSDDLKCLLMKVKAGDAKVGLQLKKNKSNDY